MENLEKIPRLVLPDDRLKTAAGMINRGGIVCDVGTDHGYIPIWLLQEGICSLAVASDIHRGPLDKARENGLRYGVADKMKLYLCDGLDGVEPEQNGITDICICGMGGELIAAIVSRSSYVRDRKVNLVLQPMSSGYELRKDLLSKQFRIVEEQLCQAADRVYSCLRVCFEGRSAGKDTSYTEGELLVGRHTDRQDPLYPLWLNRHRAALEKQIRGRMAGGLDTVREKSLLAEIENMM